jgi:hypothetical protein
MIGLMIRVNVLLEEWGWGSVGTLNIGGMCETVVLFFILAVSFLSFFVEGVSRFCLRSGRPPC